MVDAPALSRDLPEPLGPRRQVGVGIVRLPQAEVAELGGLLEWGAALLMLGDTQGRIEALHAANGLKPRVLAQIFRKRPVAPRQVEDKPIDVASAAVLDVVVTAVFPIYYAKVAAADVPPSTIQNENPAISAKTGRAASGRAGPGSCFAGTGV